MQEIISFSDAIAMSNDYTKRHLILGNGFSISCIPSIFTYKSIFEEADFSIYPEIKEIFSILGTTDFEEVVFALDQMEKIAPFYISPSDELNKKLLLHSEYIKELLVKTIAERHPDMPSSISDDKYRACRRFLSYFVSKEKKGNIYSLNYDLLLYWALMHGFEGEDFELYFNDGFFKIFDDVTHETSSELYWEGKNSEQNIHFLHGSLHLFQGSGLLEKNTWANTGVKLITQARHALNNNKFPLFVSEGNTEKKMSKIFHNPYLFCSYKSFDDVVNGGKGKQPGNTCIFSYGLSFADNDVHIFSKITSGRIKHLFVSIYGDREEEVNKSIFARCESMKEKRAEFPLYITYYNAETANVWNNF